MAELTITCAETDRTTGACSHIFATGPNGEISLSFRRTSKVPNDGRMFHTPDLGHFPLYNVDRFHGLPSSVRQAGGWFIAMRDQEAMFIDFDSNQEFAVAVGSNTSKKAHCLVKGHYYLDGLPDSTFPNCVRQFLAAPASSSLRDNSDDGTVVGGLLLDIKPSKDVFVVPDQLVTFTVDVKTLTGKTIKVGLGDDTTVEQLKTAIQDLEGIPPDQQRIILAGKQMTDETVLSSCGVVEGSVLHLVLRLRGGFLSVARPFASHMMALKPGGLIWQPNACKEAPQIALAETSTLIPIHILNAEHVRAWTGIDPPQSLVDPELYVAMGIPFVPDIEEAEELAKQNATLYHQLYEHANRGRFNTHSANRLSIIPKDDNPFTAIKFRNSKGMINENRSNRYVSPGSSTNRGGENSTVDDQNPRKKKHWWSRMFH